MDKDITGLLARWNAGDSDAGRRVMDFLYEEIRLIASRQFHGERVNHTLQPTAVANEVYIRLAEDGGVKAESRVHFLAISARIIRRVLVDHARDRGRVKRGGPELVRVEMTEGLLDRAEAQGINIIDLDNALERLAKIDKAAAEVIELKFIGGLTVDEVAEHMKSSQATVSRKWSFARAWLRAELE